VTTAIGEFFPLGSGIGTFNQVFPRFQGADLNGMFINRAHNDYLEWMMEGGIVAAVLILAFLTFYLRRWFKVWQRGEWKTFKFIQVGAGIGLFAMILHTFVDFNLHIPANQIYFAFLAALFFHHSHDEQHVHPGVSEPDGWSNTIPAEDYTPPAETALEIQPGPNPFAE
jgi:O-antigen ligase